MSHFTLTTFVATTATALAPFVIAYNLPQQKTQLSTLSSLPKPRPIATLRGAQQQQQQHQKSNSDFSLI